MSEMRLIDANAIFPNDSITVWSFDGEETARGIQKAIDNAPTIDAVPVVHARWVRDDLGHAFCSKCGGRLPYLHCYSGEPCSDYDEEWDEEIPETRYCPSCGAKMDGGAADGYDA